MSNESQATASCCSTSAPASDAMSTSQVNLLATATVSDHMTTCPVMVGTAVSKSAAEEAGLFRDYEGTRYWLCCAGCGPTFDSDPAKYAANMA